MSHCLFILGQSNSGSQAAAGIAGLIVGLFDLTIAILVIAGLWKTFAKAGQPGWGALIPIYNLYLMTKIAGREWWWMLLCLIPFVNIAIMIVLSLDIAKRFGKGAGFGVGLALLGFIFYPILGFGSATYNGGAEPRGFPVTQ